MENRSSRPIVTSGNVSPIVQAITWLLLAVMFLALTLRLLTRFYLLRKLRHDDILVAIAFIFALVQSVTLLVPASNIWGRSLQQLNADAIEPGLKAQYSGWLLFMPSICFAKLSILVGLSAITPVESHRRAIILTGIIIAIYTLTAEIALAFQCGAPDSWNYMAKFCLNRESLLLYISILNILTDLSLIAVPVFILAPLRTSIKRRIGIISLFATRILVIAATAAQISYLHGSFNKDFTFDSYPYIICTQVVEAASVVTACVPYLRPFLESLNTGLLWRDDLQSQTEGSTTVVTIGTFNQRNKNRKNYANIESQPGLPAKGTELETVRDQYERQANIEV